MSRAGDLKAWDVRWPWRASIVVAPTADRAIELAYQYEDDPVLDREWMHASELELGGERVLTSFDTAGEALR